MNRRIFIYFFVSVVLVAGYIFEDKWLPLFSGTKVTDANKSTASGGKRNTGPISVLAAKAQTGQMPISRQTIGSIVPVEASVLTTSTSGILDKVLVTDGALVKKGDLIAQLDTRTIDGTIVKDQAILLRDQATLQNSLIAAKRAKELLAKGLNSQQAGNDADTASQVAAATVNYDRAVLSADQVALSLMQIRAPFDGRLGAILLSPGAYLSPGTSVASITQLDPVFVEFALPDRDADLIQRASRGQMLTVEIRSQTNSSAAPVRGPVVFVDSTIDAISGTFKMRAQLDNSQSQLKIGQSVNVDVSAGVLKNLVLVPNQSVVPTATGNAVYVVKADSTIEMRPVDLALRNDQQAGISKGLSEGEVVVQEGQINLANGAAVTVISAAKPTPANVTTPEKSTKTGVEIQSAKKNQIKQTDGNAAASGSTAP
ncbi:MAG: efflux RND transporter periplasmic adaptor subunit [Alphaproteobacteria bacterium]|nr:efflux RND transporter periplasmic adaptor subunit [Alphaproteobacteria bacterium]